MGPKAKSLRIPVDERHGEVSALWLRPRGAVAALAFAHGAGADMNHTFMEAAAHALAERDVATLRYQFPYSEAGRRAPNPAKTLTATVRAAVERAHALADGLPLLAGGKSMGGRMTSLRAAEEPLPVRGLVFFGFPLHAAGKPPSTDRAEHLAGLDCPLLFLQGSRDKLASLELLEPLVSGLGRRARLHVIDQADHGFKVPNRTGRNAEDVIDELAETTRQFIDGIP